jgi:flagellar biosynthesis component FlhA
MNNTNNSLANNKFFITFKLSIICLVILGFTYGCNHNGNKTRTNNDSTSVVAQNNQGGQSNNNQSNNNQSNNKSKANPSSKKKQIRQNWKKFFSSKTDNETRMNLLQNGQKFKKSIQHFSSSKMAKDASVKVSKIQLNDNQKAMVTYTINLSGKPVLKNQDGKALYLSNSWKVSDETFCKLLSMSGTVPSACPQSKNGKGGS